MSTTAEVVEEKKHSSPQWNASTPPTPFQQRQPTGVVNESSTSDRRGFQELRPPALHILNSSRNDGEQHQLLADNASTSLGYGTVVGVDQYGNVVLSDTAGSAKSFADRSAPPFQNGSAWSPSLGAAGAPAIRAAAAAEGAFHGRHPLPSGPSSSHPPHDAAESSSRIPSNISYVRIKFNDDGEGDEGCTTSEPLLGQLWGESLGLDPAEGPHQAHHTHDPIVLDPSTLSLDDYEYAFQTAVFLQQNQQQQHQPLLPPNSETSVHPLKRERRSRPPPPPPPPPMPPLSLLKAPPYGPLPPQQLHHRHRRVASDSAGVPGSQNHNQQHQRAATLQRQASLRLQQLEQRLHSKRMHMDAHRGATIVSAASAGRSRGASPSSSLSPRKRGAHPAASNPWSGGVSTDPLRARKRWDGAGSGGEEGASRSGAPRPRKHQQQHQHKRSGSWSADWNQPFRTGRFHRSYGATGGGSVSSVASASSLTDRYHDAGGGTGGVLVNLPRNLPQYPPPPPPSTSGRHRRTPSALSVGAASVATDMSLVSYVADIRKSQFFSHYNNKGQAQLFFPISRVHLVMNDDTPLSSSNRRRAATRSTRARRSQCHFPSSLPVGRLYQVPIDPEAYELYHRFDDDCYDDDVSLLEAGERGLGIGGCECPCPHCATCTGGRLAQALPPVYYAMAVPDDLYRRVLDEIVLARTMPCRSYFCGHHEDVSRPSTAIAAAVVSALLLLMAAAAYTVQS